MRRSDLTIVPMTRGHAAACAAIVSESEPWRTLGEGIDFLPSIRSGQAHVALIEGAVAGFVIFTPEPVFARGGYLRAIGVAPAIRGFGVGRRLLQFAEQETAKRTPNLFLCASSFNRPAQTFYRKLGYVRVGGIRDLIRKGASEEIYWKPLGKRRRRT